MKISTLISKSGESEQEIQEATAKALAEARMKEFQQIGSFYLIKVEDPTMAGKIRTFLSFKRLVESPNTLDITGIELNKTQTKALSITSIEEYVKEGKSEILSIRFPWTKIINIQEIKKAKKV